MPRSPFSSPYNGLMRIALAHLNPTVGDLRGNLRKHLDAIREASKRGDSARDLSGVEHPGLSAQGFAVETRGAVAFRPRPSTKSPAPARASRPSSELPKKIPPMPGVRCTTRWPSCVMEKFSPNVLSRCCPPMTYSMNRVILSPARMLKSPSLTAKASGFPSARICGRQKFLERPLYHFNPIEALAEPALGCC